MSTSWAAACILVLLALCAGTALLDFPAPVSMVIQLLLILVAALIGSRVNRH